MRFPDPLNGCFWPFAARRYFPKADIQTAGLGKSGRSTMAQRRSHSGMPDSHRMVLNRIDGHLDLARRLFAVEPS